MCKEINSERCQFLFHGLNEMKMKVVVLLLCLISAKYINGMATLDLPKSTNCLSQAVLTCKSFGCYQAYTFFKNGISIYNHFGPLGDFDPGKYNGTVTSNSTAKLTITNIQLSDEGNYSCTCGFDYTSISRTLPYTCMASTSTAEIMSNKALRIKVDELYPHPLTFTTNLTSASKLPGTHTCEPSPTLASHYMCTWVSTASLPDGNHNYTIMVDTAQVYGSFRIVTPSSPTISNVTTNPNNDRQVLHGKQDTPLTIECVSRGGIPAPTLAWYSINTSTLLAQSNTSDSIQQPDGTYTVILAYGFTPSITNDLMSLFCQLFYPDATSGASPYPAPATALLYLDLKPDTPTVSQTGEAVSGGSMVLRCTSVNGRPAPNITWSYRGQTFTPTNTTSLNQTSETYTVVSVLQRPVSAEDNGVNVTCSMSHTTLSVPLKATVQVDVKFGPSEGSTTISGNQEMAANGTNKIRLNCTSGSSNPASSITWYNGSDVIENTSNYTRWSGKNNGMITSYNLTIILTRYMDGSTITCRPDNGYGVDSKNINLSVLYSPLIQPLPNITTTEGQPDFSLTCSASSKPPAKFSWYKDSTALKSGTNTRSVNSFSYVISRVDRTDNGSYRCQADNNVGIPDSKSMYVFVQYPPKVTVSTTVSSTYAITCTAEGYPDNYTYQDWVQIWPGYGPVATIPFTWTTLTLTDATYEKSGVYVCNASNGVAEYGTDVKNMNGNGTVLIYSPPVLTDPYPGGTNVLVEGRLGQEATTEIRYWSNVDGSVVKCYKHVGDSRSSSSRCSVTETNTEVTLPVHNHMVKETGTLAKIKINISSEEDMADYEVVVSNVQGESVLGITIVPQGNDSRHGPSSGVALIAGGVSGVFVLVAVSVVVFITCKRRKDNKRRQKGKDTRRREEDSNSSAIVVECVMYESAGNVQPGPSTADHFSKPKKKCNTPVADVYAVVSKPKKDLYENAPKPVGRNVDNFSPMPLKVSEKTKKNANTDGLVYAELEFNKNHDQSVIHGIDDATTYVQVDFTKAADPLPDCDEEANVDK